MSTQSNDPGAGGKKVYNVPDMIPGPGFIIEIRERDGDQNPVRAVEFKYTIDNTVKGSNKTDKKGTLVVKPLPKREVKIIL